MIVANENVVDAWEEAKLNFFPEPDTILINSDIYGSLHGLSLSKKGFIIELVIKSEIRTAVIHKIIFLIILLLLKCQSHIVKNM